MITDNKTLARELGMYASEIKDGVYYIVKDAPMVSKKEEIGFIKNLNVCFDKITELFSSKTSYENYDEKTCYLSTDDLNPTVKTYR